MFTTKGARALEENSQTLCPTMEKCSHVQVQDKNIKQLFQHTWL